MTKEKKTLTITNVYWILTAVRLQEIKMHAVFLLLLFAAFNQLAESKVLGIQREETSEYENEIK